MHEGNVEELLRDPDGSLSTRTWHVVGEEPTLTQQEVLSTLDDKRNTRPVILADPRPPPPPNLSIAKQVPEMNPCRGQPGCWGSRWTRPATAPWGAFSPSWLQSWEGAGSAPLQLPGCGVRDRHGAGGGEAVTPEPQDHVGTGRERSVGPWGP